MAIAPRPGIMACRPHLVLPHIADNNSLTLCRLVDPLQNANGVWQVVVTLDTLTTLFSYRLPRTDLFEPSTMILRGHYLSQRRQSHLRISDNRYRSNLNLMHLRRINIDMNNPCIGSEPAHLTSHAVIKAQTHTNNHISFANRTIYVCWPMHTRQPQMQRMSIRETTLTQ